MESCGAVLCRAVQYRAVLCRAVPCCAVLCRAVPCSAVLSSAQRQIAIEKGGETRRSVSNEKRRRD